MTILACSREKLWNTAIKGSQKLHRTYEPSFVKNSKTLDKERSLQPKTNNVTIWHRVLRHSSVRGHVHDLCFSFAKLCTTEAARSQGSRLRTTTPGTRAAKPRPAKRCPPRARLRVRVRRMWEGRYRPHTSVYSNVLPLHWNRFSVEDVEIVWVANNVGQQMNCYMVFLIV